MGQLRNIKYPGPKMNPLGGGGPSASAKNRRLNHVDGLIGLLRLGNPTLRNEQRNGTRKSEMGAIAWHTQAMEGNQSDIERQRVYLMK